MEMLTDVFADFVNFSFPWDESAGVFEDFCDVVRSGNYEGSGMFRTLNGGTVKEGRRNGVRTLSVSGAALQVLRDHQALMVALSVVGSLPHRVTMLHATLDLKQDAPPVIADLFWRGRGDGIFLTRKAVPGRTVKRVLGLDPEGRESGTVYLGSRKADVWLKVYDKRLEILDRLAAGGQEDARLFPDGGLDPGPRTRYEVCLGRKVGCTLRDVAAPAAVFWHHMRRILPALVPDGFREWEPHGEGFEVRRRSVAVGAQLELALGGSEVRRLARIAAALGPRGVEHVLAELRTRLEALIAARPERLEGASPSHPRAAVVSG